MTRGSWAALVAFALTTAVCVFLLLGVFAPKTTVIPLSQSNSVVSASPELPHNKLSSVAASNRVETATAMKARTDVAPSPAVANTTTPAQIAPVVSKPVAAPPDFDEPSPQAVIENMRGSFRDYQSMFGGNPVGTNPEITKSLNGDNPRHATFIHPEDGLRINDRGELIDPWGTPFFFHQLSAREMEIHSAGPDRVMWTADDLVTR